MTKSNKTRKRGSRNPLVHGLYSKDVLLPWDSKDDFEGLHHGLRDEFFPQGRAEEEAVLDLALTHWKKHTLWRMQQSALLKDPFTLEIAETKGKSWREIRKKLREKMRSEESMQSIALDTVSTVRSEVQRLLREIEQTSDREEIKKLDEKMAACTRLLADHAAPFLQLVSELPNAGKAFDNVYAPDNIEKIVRLEAALDARIAKILGRLVGLKEFKRTPAGAAPSRLEVKPPRSDGE